jgi:putative ABC transport system permease protein
LAGIVALAVYGGVAIGGAREDLLRGIDRATSQYFSTAPVWVTAGRDVFNTNGFPPNVAVRALANARGVASVRVYRGGLLDVGERRVWVRGRPPGDASILESSQLLHGSYARASRLIGEGGFAAASSFAAGRGGWRLSGWAAVSADFAQEHGLRVGGTFALATPTGEARLGVAAITTNSGWPAGAITLGAPTYSRLWGSREAAALEVSLKPGVSVVEGRNAVLAALGLHTGLDVRTAEERERESGASARQGLRTLGEISTLLLVAAALSVASALSAAIWQRRLRLAALKLQGYDPGQLWGAVLLESALTISVGAFVGGALGIVGHALAGRFLQLTTGFPAPFAVGAPQVVLTVALFLAIALVVIALPGLAAARISPRAAWQE